MPPAKKTTRVTAADVLSARMDGLDSRLERIDETMRSVAKSLSEVVKFEERLANLASQHNRLDGRVDEAYKSIAALKEKMPGLEETRKYALSATFGVIAIVGVAIIGVVFTPTHVSTAISNVVPR